MTPEFLFIHGAGDQSEGGGSSRLREALKAELAISGRFYAPLMPNPEIPDCAEWEAELARLLERAHGGTILVGHSLGGSVLLKYLTENRLRERVAGVFAIASPYWGADPDWDVDAFKFHTDAPERPDDVRHVHIYHSRDDEVVPFEHHAAYARKFPWAKLRAVDGVGHDFVAGLQAVIRDIQSTQADYGSILRK